jgi:hypothetical protein
MAMSLWSVKEFAMKLFSPRSPLIFALLVLGAPTLRAQDSSTTRPSETPAAQGPSNNGVYTGREVYVPDAPPPSEPEPAARSFSDGFLRNTRQHIGFSVSAFESYTPNAFGPSTEHKAITLASILPEVHANFQKKGLDFRIGYGAVFNRYGKDLSQLNRISQTGTATFGYSVSRRKTRLQVTDFLSSFYNDPASFPGSTTNSSYRLDSAPQIYIDRRRETRNQATIGLSQALTRKSGIGVTLTHDTFRYSGSDLQPPQLLAMSVFADYQINKWMHFNLQYSHYLNHLGQELRNSNVENLQIAGFVFKLGKGWQLSSSGGIESTKAQASRSIVGGGQVEIGKSSSTTSFGANYHRGYSSVFPVSSVWYGDTANLHLVQWLSSRVSIHANSSYFSGSLLTDASVISTVSGSGGLDIALQKNLIVSANYFVVSQKLVNVSVGDSSLHRNTVSVGLQYYLPGVSRR